jgi:UDP-N-acetylmuramoyl-tripeptide--D-alanyl-D-alanine ligase
VIKLTIQEIADIVDGMIENIDSGASTRAIPVIDSRKAKPGTFFVAFNGEHNDGHNFINEAIGNGAEFALVTKSTGAPSIRVADVLEALTKLAIEVRSRLVNLKVIGITGSQGKTTTKDLLKHLLSISGETVAAINSYNNELGVPLLLLRCNENTKFCIVEMGARHLGDISHLVAIAKPQVGVVLVVGKAHLGEFGSRENIATAKSELIGGLPSEGVAILGNYDEFTPLMAVDKNLKIINFGEKPGCDVRAADVEVREGRAHFDLVTPDGRAAVSLQLLGLHQIPNALAAAAVATSLRIPIDSIAAALSTAEVSSKWRMEIIDRNELLVINDSYNANPESMAAALRTLVLIAQERGGASWAFLGKMNELGASSALEHQKIGRLVSEIGIDHLVSVGTNEYQAGSEGESELHFFPTHLAALEMVDHFAPGDVVLVKASRSEGFEVLAAELISKWEAISL